MATKTKTKDDDKTDEKAAAKEPETVRFIETRGGNAIVFGASGVIARFADGFLETDDEKLIKQLDSDKYEYIRREKSWEREARLELEAQEDDDVEDEG